MTPIRQQIFYYILGTLALITVLYLGAYRPTLQHIEATNDSMLATQAEVAEYNRIVMELPAILEEERVLQAERQTLNSSLYAKGDILALFERLSRDAATFDLKLVQITPPISELLELNRQATVESSPLFLDITLDFEGQYVNFGKFVSDLETKPYFLAVKSCRMSGRPASPFIDLSLSFKALLGTTEGTRS